jgi:hypothetical protein
MAGMAWFQRICRDVGLMLHNVAKPDHSRKVVKKDVQQEKRGNVTLRRTTIEEIEINAHHPRQPADDEDQDDQDK